jgi:WD40 repeat protein
VTTTWTFSTVTRFKVLDRFPSHFAVHGGPKFSPDGRFVYFASRDGWISLYDLHNLRLIAEVRVGLNTRNLAVSKDGRWVLAGNYLPGNLVLLDARDLSLVKILDDWFAGQRRVHRAAAQQLYRRAQGCERGVGVGVCRRATRASSPGASRPRTCSMTFRFLPDYRQLVATSRKAGGGQVIDLDSGEGGHRHPAGGYAAPGLGHLLATRWAVGVRHAEYQQRADLGAGPEDLGADQGQIPTLGPGFFMRSHSNSRYVWSDVFFAPGNDAIHLIDKQTLEIAHTLRPMPGKTAAHVEFTKDGRYLLLSIWDREGALIVYDSQTLQEVKRIPMNKPSGKYNVGNKIEFAEGTSH